MPDDSGPDSECTSVIQPGGTRQPAHQPLQDALDRADPCPTCDEPQLQQTADGSIVCATCDTVIAAEPVDHGPQWLPAAARDDQSGQPGVGAPRTPTRHDYGIGSTIGETALLSDSDRDARPAAVDTRRRRLNIQSRYRSETERTLRDGLASVSRIVTARGLSTAIEETAAQVFRYIHSTGLVSGWPLSVAVGTAVYIAARIDGHARTFDEIAAVSRADVSRIRSFYNTVIAETELTVPLQMADEYLPRYASRLDVDPQVEQSAHALADLFDDTVYETSGVSQHVIAAVALYFACELAGQPITQTALAATTGVAPRTLRSHIADIDAAFDRATLVDHLP